ncbi:MAG: hypothetical protein OXC65_04995 [Thiotrichales bacterium]|nr:hypothetical protein [Thiotrichales bacterium]
MKARTSLWASLAIAASVGLAGCGGSSNNTDDDAGGTQVTSYTVTLPAGHGLEAGTEEFESGETKLADGTTVTCPSEDGCTLTVTEGETSGSLTASSTGGMVAVAAPAQTVEIDLPAGNNIRDRLDQDDEDQTPGFLDGKSTTIDAGETLDYAGVLFSCPAGGSDCRITFVTDPVGVKVTTGGEGSGVATAELKSQVGTGVGLRTLRDEITDAPGSKAAGNSLADRLGFPHENDANPFASRHLKAPSLEAAEANSNAAAAASGLDGWNGAAWQEGRETVVRFDNQPKAESFADAHGLKIDDANNVTSAEDDAGSDFWDLVRAAVAPFPSRPQVTTIAALDAAVDAAYKYRIAATFDGVAGTLTCAQEGTTCDSLTAEGTKLSGNVGDGTGWTFTATRATDEVSREGTKDDYLAFGWWRQDQSAGGGFSGFEPVYGGRIPFPTTGSTLNGKATYSGGAAGNYTDYSGRRAPSGVDGTFTEEAPDRHGGWFVADAKLTANFGDAGTSTTADDNRITGMISNFRGAHGSLGDWEVKLSNTAPAGNLTPSADPTEGGEANIIDANTNTSGDADGEPWGGDWGATFYGETLDRDGDGANDRLPSGVAGWFHAQTQHSVGDTAAPSPTPTVAVQGSFAATRTP